MKIALIGNMNNNHFSLMRYLRDLGVDAHLFLYANDGAGTVSHFIPENDTYDINKWKPYIHRLKLYNGGKIALLQMFFSFFYLRKLRSFDKIIANGIFPVYCLFSFLKIDIFLPYSVGGDFLNYQGSNTLRNKFVFYILRFFQKIGLKTKAKKVFLADLTEIQTKNFHDLGINPEPVAIPMVYLESPINKIQLLESEKFRDFIELSKNKFILFSHVSHIWKSKKFMSQVKRNNILIEGFANYLKISNAKKFSLVLCEYGVDVDESKKLINHLGIEDYVLWMPKLIRKEIIILLDFVTLGASEFGGCLWGGVGWEFIAKGVPFMHNLDEKQFVTNQEYLNKLPHFYNTKSPSDVERCLIDIEINDTVLNSKKEVLKDWFKKNQGENLVRKYIESLNDSLNS